MGILGDLFGNDFFDFNGDGNTDFFEEFIALDLMTGGDSGTGRGAYGDHGDSYDDGYDDVFDDEFDSDRDDLFSCDDDDDDDDDIFGDLFGDDDDGDF